MSGPLQALADKDQELQNWSWSALRQNRALYYNICHSIPV